MDKGGAKAERRYPCPMQGSQPQSIIAPTVSTPLHQLGSNMACETGPMVHTSMPNFTMIGALCHPCRAKKLPKDGDYHTSKFHQILNFGGSCAHTICWSGLNFACECGPRCTIQCQIWLRSVYAFTHNNHANLTDLEIWGFCAHSFHWSWPNMAHKRKPMLYALTPNFIRNGLLCRPCDQIWLYFQFQHSYAFMANC